MSELSEPIIYKMSGDDEEIKGSNQNEPAAEIIDPEILKQIKDAVSGAERFIAENSAVLSKIMGVGNIHIKIGQGWATNTKSCEVTVDPTFFIKEGYSQDWVNYAMMHEVSAHLLGIIKDPRHTKERLNFAAEDEPRHMFMNILEDIAGNKRIHSLLPFQQEVAANLYEQRLFPTSDYSNIPRHIQFLYKLLREEMIPNSSTTVQDDVDKAIQRVRNNEGVDIIELSTNRFEPEGEKELSYELQFRFWKDIVYPEFDELLEKDKQDDRFKDEEGNYNFDEYYQDYSTNKHPEPIDHHSIEEALDQAIVDLNNNTLEGRAEAKIKEKIGPNNTVQEYMWYRKTMNKLLPEIDNMTDFFSKLLDERLTYHRRLKSSDEGQILDPNNLAQTYVDIKSGAEPKDAYLEYHVAEKERMAEGRFDFYLAVDCSSSMQQEDRFRYASNSTVVFIEGLAAFERQIRERERSGQTQLNWDVRSSVYSFGQSFEVLKPLSHSLSERERVDTLKGLNKLDGSTKDFLALNDIARSIEQESIADYSKRNRRRIVVVVTDGGSDSTDSLQQSIGRLTSMGVELVAIGIKTDYVKEVYPRAKSIDDVRNLSKTLSELIELEVSK